MPSMYLGVDVHYTGDGARAAGVVFRDIGSCTVEQEYVGTFRPVSEYQPGRFSRRELPAILELLKEIEHDCTTIIIDGYVWLSPDRQPGLGAHLYEALPGKTAVIGVAKSAFRDASMAARVFRGRSARPLYVTAIGMEQETAADLVRNMHGPYRLPTLLKHVDRLSRGHAG